MKLCKMLIELSSVMLIVGWSSSLATQYDGKSCKKICVTVKKCTDGLCDEPLYPGYSKCEIKCDIDEITETIGNVVINRHSLSDAIDEEKETNSNDNFLKINDIRDLRNHFSNNLRENLMYRKRDFDTKSRYSGSGDSDVIAVLIVNNDDGDIRQQARNTVYKSSSIPSPTIHPLIRLQNHTTVTHLYPDFFRRFLEYYINKIFSVNKTLRKNNFEITGLKNHPLDVIHSERPRRVKRTVGKLLLDSLSLIGAGAEAGLSAGAAVATGGSIGGTIGGGFGVQAGPAGISADISGKAAGQASGYTRGAAGIATNAGLGVGQSDLLIPGTILPGYGAGLSSGAGLSAGAAAAKGGSIGGSVGGGIGVKADPEGISANVSGKATGQASGYTRGAAGIATNAGLGVGQPGVLIPGTILPGYVAGLSSGAGLSAGTEAAAGGSIGGSVGGGIGLKAGPEGISADVSGKAAGQTSGYTSGRAGIAASGGSGVGQPGLLLPGYGAGVGTSTSVGGGVGGTVDGSLGGSLGVGIGPGLTGVRAGVDGGASGKLSGYRGYQTNSWGGLAPGYLGSGVVGGGLGGYNDGRYFVHSLTEDV